jgi:hypothetical protein
MVTPPNKFSELLELINPLLLLLFFELEMFTVLLDRLEDTTLWLESCFGKIDGDESDESSLELRFENIAILSLTLFLLGSSTGFDDEGRVLEPLMLISLGGDDDDSKSFFLSSKLHLRAAIIFGGGTGGTEPGGTSYEED